MTNVFFRLECPCGFSVHNLVNLFSVRQIPVGHWTYFKYVELTSVIVSSGGLRPEPGGTAPPQVLFHATRYLHPPMIFAKITQISYFFAFPNCRKIGKFAASIECLKTKSASASGGNPPDRLIRGSAPGPRWGLCPILPL